jgi:hypothetical protein
MGIEKAETIEETPNIINNITEKHNITQYELALLLDTNQSTIYRWSSGDQQPSSKKHKIILEYISILTKEQFISLLKELSHIRTKFITMMPKYIPSTSLITEGFVTAMVLNYIFVKNIFEGESNAE